MGGDDLMKFAGYATAENGGKDRADAIRVAFEWMDRFSKGRKTKAEDRYEVFKVRNLGFYAKGNGQIRWWRVYFRMKTRGKKETNAAA